MKPILNMKDGQNIQTLQQPCISVWTVSALPNDDIVVGGSDAVARIFTREAERTAVPEALKVIYIYKFNDYMKSWQF